MWTGAVADTVRLQQLAADLLLLARLDAGERPGEGRVVDWRRSYGRRWRSSGRGPHPVLLGELAEGEVAGSRAQLARVLGNLLQNAQRHAASEVRVAVREDGRGREWVELEVADDGPGVPDARAGADLRALRTAGRRPQP